jgi:SAM-dependent methyltransferase
LTAEELEQLLKTVGERDGWDFSRVRDQRDPVPWDYRTVVRQYLRPTDHVLDVGTGGGENFLVLAPHFGTGVGVDADPAMIAAQRNQQKQHVDHVHFTVMAAEQLQVADESFDVVLNRHSVVQVSEVVRVLKPGGYFIHQNVGQRNTANFFAAFGWSQQHFGDDLWPTVAQLAHDFGAADCQIRAVAEYDVPYRFLDVPSFIFWCTAIPWPEPFDPDKHWPAINAILDRYTTARGIETNEHRELLIVQKQKE